MAGYQFLQKQYQGFPFLQVDIHTQSQNHLHTAEHLFATAHFQFEPNILIFYNA